MRKSETTLDLALHLAERISRCQKILDQIQAAVPPHKHEVADLVRDFESTMQEITCSPDVLRIWDQEMREQHIGPGLETLQPASFDQFEADLTEARSGLVIAESVTRDEAKPHIDVARTVAVTTLEAEIRRPANRECARGMLGRPQRAPQPSPRPSRSRAATRFDRIHVAHPRLSGAATIRYPDAGDSRARRQWRGCSERESSTDRCVGRRPRRVPPYLRRGSKALSTARPRRPSHR